eukprot:gene26827-32414_t
MESHFMRIRIPLSSIGSPNSAKPPVHWINKFGQESPKPSPTVPIGFSVVTYNVLGPLHGQSMKHQYAPVSVTKWSRRSKHLVEHIHRLHADILCLQEVSHKGLKETFAPKLRHVNLELTGFAPSRTLNGAKGALAHKYVGCATFHCTDKLDSLVSQSYLLRDFIPKELYTTSSAHQILRDVGMRHNPIMLSLLRHKDSNRSIVVVNCHLYWDPRRADIKAIQAASIGNAIQRFLEEVRKNETLAHHTSSTLPIILCGDFNALPMISQTNFSSEAMRSGVFEVLSTGRLGANHPHHPNMWHADTSYPYKGAPPQLGEISSPLFLNHAYDVRYGFAEHAPLFTTKTDEFSGSVDHVWLSGDVSVDGMLCHPLHAGNRSELESGAQSFEPMPNKVYPSDHLPVGVSVSLLQ